MRSSKKREAAAENHILIDKTEDCSIDNYCIKFKLKCNNVYYILPFIQEIPIKQLTDITYSVKEAYLKMEEEI